MRQLFEALYPIGATLNAFKLNTRLTFLLGILIPRFVGVGGIFPFQHKPFDSR